VFTGIIEETGRIEDLRHGYQGATINIAAKLVLAGMKQGDSIAVNGVCLTVVQKNDASFVCDLSSETLRRTSLGKAREGTVVNLERPLAMDARLGGHFVQGHVDAVGRVARMLPEGGGSVLSIEFPPDLGRYVVPKGSIAVDGISLTIASLEPRLFSVAIIPHTLRATNLRTLRAGDPVNLEVDILGKYVERLLQPEMQQNNASKWNVEYLKEQGF
jgi:riboflavin synthase